ncbi:Merlin [Carabus blaptoides fortunei]
MPLFGWKNSGKEFPVQVITLDAELEFNLEWRATGRDLFDLVCRTIGLRETYYFGLEFEDSNGLILWLKMDKKVQDQCCLNDRVNEQIPLKFMFLVKFYPEDVTKDLIQEVTQHLFFLQVKQAILSMDIYCPPEASVLLASYALHAKFGDYEEDTYQSTLLANEKLLPEHVISQYRLTRQMWEDHIKKWYADHRGMFRVDTEMEYLKLAQVLDMYGVNYFPIVDKEKTELWLGVTALGLNIYEKENKLQPRITFKWPDIKEFGFTGKKFVITLIALNTKNYVYISKKGKINKLIMSLCIGNHDLFIFRRKPDSMEMQQMKAVAKEEKLRRMIHRNKLDREKQLREEAERDRALLQQQLHAYMKHIVNPNIRYVI